MQPVSADFLNAIVGDHDIAIAVEVYDPRQGAVIWRSTDHPEVRIIDGSVTLSKAANFRSQFNLKLVDPTFAAVPAFSDDPLSPYGNQVRLYRGVRYSNGTTELVRLCTCRITQSATDETDGGVTISLSGFGLERNVSRNVVPYYWPPTSMVSYLGLLALVDSSNQPVTPDQCPFITDFISVLISDRYPQAVFNTNSYSGPAPFSTPSAWANESYVPTGVGIRLNYASSLNLSQGADPWSTAKQAADLIGCDLYADRYGVFTLVRDPNLLIMDNNFAGNAVAEFIEGSTATFQNGNKTLSDEDGANAFVVVGAGSSLVGPVETPFYQDIDNSSTFPIASAGAPGQIGVGDNYNQMTPSHPGDFFVDPTTFASFSSLPGFSATNGGSIAVQAAGYGLIVITYTGTGSYSFKGAVTQPQDAPPSVTVSSGDTITSLFHAANPYVSTGDQRSGNPVTYDSDPASPTYYFGPYGKVTKVVNNSLVFSSQVAQAYSEVLLKRALGVQEQVQFDNICNPALDVDDVIRIQRERLGVDNLYVIDSVTIPMTVSGKQTVKLRQRRNLEPIQ